MATTKAKFGVSNFAKHSPKWLVPAVSAIILTIGVVQFTISGDPSFSDEIKLRINHYLTALGMLISGIAPLFGVDSIKKNEESK